MHAIAAGDAAEGSLDAENADDARGDVRVGDAPQRLAVRDPEVRALQDALLGEEAIAVLVPRHDALGRAADRIEDRLLGLGLRQQRFELLARRSRGRGSSPR